MDDKVKLAIEALAGYAAGRPPTTMDAFDALKGVRFHLGGGDELMALMTALDGEGSLTQNERERIVNITGFVETAVGDKEPLVTGFVNEKLEPEGSLLSSREANFVQMLASACWGIPTRPDEPMPRTQKAPPPSAAPPIDPDSLPSLGTVRANPSPIPGSPPPLSDATATGPGPTVSAARQPVQPAPAPTPPRFVRTTRTGPDDPVWAELRKEILDPIFARRDRAEAARDLKGVDAIDRELDWVEGVMLVEFLQESQRIYGDDNTRRMKHYVMRRRAGFHRAETAEFEERFGPAALMV